jgi:hypothetical protein
VASEPVAEHEPLPPLIVVSGLSGSGKSVALRTLEDLGYYCVDNLPSELLPEFVASISHGGAQHPKLAVGIDVRNRPEDLSHLPESLSTVGALGYQHQLVFLDTRDEVLIRRYSETRRRHPLSDRGLPLADAIALERRLLKPLMAIADRVIDSSDYNIHQLPSSSPSWRWSITRGCRSCSNRSPIATACRPMRISCSTCGACRIRTGMRACGRYRAATPRCATTSTSNLWRAITSNM